MAKLIYSSIASLDGFVEDVNGHFDWAEPSEEVFAYINERERPVGTYLYGRSMYETMVYWETYEADDDESAVAREFAEIWKSADKIVYSTTLTKVSSTRTRIEPAFNAEAIVLMKAALDRDITIGGAAIASAALDAGLVDEVHLYLLPILLGNGKPAFANNEHVKLRLLEERRFDNGQVLLRYAVLA